MSRIRYGGTPGAGDGQTTPDDYVPEGFSLDKAYQDQEAGGTIRTRTTRGAGRDGLKVQEGKLPYYKIEDRNPEPSNPAPAPQAPVLEEEAAQLANIQLSRRAAEANAGTGAYENILLNRQGDATILGDTSAVQDFKNAYQNNLTEELKAKAPATLANKKAEIELADRQVAEMQDNFSLNLGSY